MERSVDIALDCLDVLGEPSEKHLIIELMGRYSNIILTAQDGMIIDCLRRVDMLMSELRQVLPGLFYRLPPAQDKRDPLSITKEELSALLIGFSADKAADKWLLDTFNGFSPLLTRELVHRAYGDTGMRMADVIEKDGGKAFSDSFFSLTGDINAGRFDASMLLDADGKPHDFSYTPILQYGSAMRLERADGFSELLDVFYTRRSSAERMRQRSQALTKSIRNAHDRVLRKLENQREELKKTLGRERFREMGDMVTANMHLIRKGMALFRTVDFY
jgi:predicted ribosome quality control (RQC) complex YloA/Tae2 family protein